MIKPVPPFREPEIDSVTSGGFGNERPVGLVCFTGGGSSPSSPPSPRPPPRLLLIGPNARSDAVAPPSPNPPPTAGIGPPDEKPTPSTCPCCSWPGATSAP